ncbi:MAG: [FeFe] hydrogenase H-cluster radical SAM maturase HydG [Armatimonadota bacterium]
MSSVAQWSRQRVEEVAAAVCNPAEVAELLVAGREASPGVVADLLYEARNMKGLSPAQVAVLIQITDPELRVEIVQTARQVHEQAYGRRLGIFAPVCPTNRCVDDCLYCPLRRSNSQLKRTMARPREVQREVKDLLDEGHRRLIMVFGNDQSGLPYILDMVEAACGAGHGYRQVQRVDLNLDPLPSGDLARLRHPAVGTYHVFQETYDREQYEALHPKGPKADYEGRLTAHDQALEAGLDEVGLGLLLGAGPYPFDVVALVAHAQHLAQTHGNGPHTVTLQRMVAAAGAPASREPERQISDEDFIFIVAVTRLALPYTGIIMSTPAKSEVRRELYSTGISEVMAGAYSYPGVYTDDGKPEAGGRLVVGRARPLETVIYRMCEYGFVPNLCTSCYARRRHDALRGAESPKALTGGYCAPNALLALKEYLMDFASPQTTQVVERVIQSELGRMPEKQRAEVLERMEEIEAGMRDSLI